MSELNNLLNDLATSYRIVANDRDRIKLSKYHQALNAFIIEYKTLQQQLEGKNQALLDIKEIFDKGTFEDGCDCIKIFDIVNKTIGGADK